MNYRLIWKLEEGVWLEGLPFYKRTLAPDCVMVFPGPGVVRAAEIFDGLQSAARWRTVEMSKQM